MDYEGRAPLELPQLRRWIGQLIENYDALVRRGEIGYSEQEIRLYRDALISAAQACDGEFKRPVKARIRELLALGAASYGLPAAVPRPRWPADVPRAEPLSAPAMIDFTVCALWPVATMPGLPRGWLGAFLNVTRSTHLASLVVRARYRLGTPEAMSPSEFGQALAEINYAPGVWTLLDDLGDPGRGGCALTGMAIAHARYAPRRGATQKRVAQWALAAATGGTAVRRVPAPRPRFVPASRPAGAQPLPS